jgi:hypothetical protein
MKRVNMAVYRSGRPPCGRYPSGKVACTESILEGRLS